MNTTTKKFALATLAAHVLAALAIGMAGAAHADNGTANHPVNNRVNSDTGRGGDVGNPIRGDLPIAPMAGPHSSGAGTTARKPMLGAQATSPKLTVVSTATPGTPVADIDRWSRAVTDYTNYGNFLDGTNYGNFLNG